MRVIEGNDWLTKLKIMDSNPTLGPPKLVSQKPFQVPDQRNNFCFNDMSQATELKAYTIDTIHCALCYITF